MAEKTETKTEETPAAEEKKSTTYEGVVAGKYDFDVNAKPRDAEAEAGAEITKYAFSDGKKNVSVYVELPGLDDVADDQITTSIDGETKVELVIGAVGTPAKKRVLKLHGLFAEITGAKATNKKGGKNMISLKLTKKEEAPWPKLLATQGTGGGGGGDDEEEGGGGGMMGGGGGGMMGGMGGGMMGGMGGGMMGGMGGGMMGGMGGGGMMGGMGGDGGMGGMDIAEMMKGMDMGGAGGGMGGPGGDDEGDEEHGGHGGHGGDGGHGHSHGEGGTCNADHGEGSHEGHGGGH